MKAIGATFIFTLAATFAYGQTVQNSRSAENTAEAKVLVKTVYSKVISIQPIGINNAAGVGTFLPYLSKNLRQQIDLAASCEEDFYRKYPQKDLKPPLRWLELDIFSGDGEMAAPSAFKIERVHLEKNGTARADITLTHAETREPDWTRRVEAVLARESGRYVVDDIVYLSDDKRAPRVRLVNLLSMGCDGQRWVGDKTR